MGMFERLGEKVERFKQEAVAARDDSAEYRCHECGTEFHSERETSPECGSAEIERVSTATESDAEPEASADPETGTETDARTETE